MQLVNAVFDRVKAIRGVNLRVVGFDPCPDCTNKFIQVLDRSSPLECLTLKGITDRSVFWSEVLKYAFRNPPQNLGLEEAEDSRLATSLKAMRRTTTLIPNIYLEHCIIDDELLSLLLTMPLCSFVFGETNRIRGDFLTTADALASNNKLNLLYLGGEEVSSSFTEALSNGIARNVTLKSIWIWSDVTFSALCRAVGRNCSIREARFPVASLMDEACMLELSQNPSLQELIVENGPGIFSWPAMSSFLQANPSLKSLDISRPGEGNDPSDDDLCKIGQSLAVNTSLESLILPNHLDNSTWKGYEELLSGLGCNTTLRSVHFGASRHSPKLISRASFDQVMERNYGLEDVSFHTGHSTRLLETICKLNAAGRKYMLADPTSRKKGVNVLSIVIRDLDCLYYHLREKPSLCNLNVHLNEVSALPAKSRKRRRCHG